MTDDTAARLRALDRDAVERLMKRCQVGVGGRNALNEAHDIMADCYGTLGRMLLEIDALRRERDEAKRVIDDAYAALGGDAWWMDPPDGGSPTLAEMVAKANEDGRALYDVKRKRDAAMAMLRVIRDHADTRGAMVQRIDAILGDGAGERRYNCRNADFCCAGAHLDAVRRQYTRAER